MTHLQFLLSFWLGGMVAYGMIAFEGIRREGLWREHPITSFLVYVLVVVFWFLAIPYNLLEDKP